MRDWIAMDLGMSATSKISNFVINANKTDIGTLTEGRFTISTHKSSFTTFKHQKDYLSANKKRYMEFVIFIDISEHKSNFKF